MACSNKFIVCVLNYGEKDFSSILSTWSLCLQIFFTLKKKETNKHSSNKSFKFSCFPKTVQYQFLLNTLISDAHHNVQKISIIKWRLYLSFKEIVIDCDFIYTRHSMDYSTLVDSHTSWQAPFYKQKILSLQFISRLKENSLEMNWRRQNEIKETFFFKKWLNYYNVKSKKSFLIYLLLVIRLAKGSWTGKNK